MNKLRLTLRIMYLALRKSGFRSLMALGSVGLGIGAMMIMLALSSGAERELQAVTDRIGKNLFVSKVGETIWVNNVPFDVVGQLKEKGFTDGQNEDDQILIPLETAERRLFNADYLSRVMVQVDDGGDMLRVQAEARDVLRATHALDQNTKDDFDILTLIRADQIRKMNSAFLEGLSQLFAIVTLAIGGAGVLAVTYLNVKDRTSEIGLRMAIGARQRDIAGMFIAEACLLSALGGLCGIVIGWLATGALMTFTHWQMAVDWRGIAVPFAVSVVLGLMFGVGPALQASKVMPVEALRDA